MPLQMGGWYRNAGPFPSRGASLLTWQIPAPPAASPPDSWEQGGTLCRGPGAILGHILDQAQVHVLRTQAPPVFVVTTVMVVSSALPRVPLGSLRTCRLTAQILVTKGITRLIPRVPIFSLKLAVL